MVAQHNARLYVQCYSLHSSLSGLLGRAANVWTYISLRHHESLIYYKFMQFHIATNILLLLMIQFSMQYISTLSSLNYSVGFFVVV